MSLHAATSVGRTSVSKWVITHVYILSLWNTQVVGFLIDKSTSAVHVYTFVGETQSIWRQLMPRIAGMSGLGLFGIAYFHESQALRLYRPIRTAHDYVQLLEFRLYHYGIPPHHNPVRSYMCLVYTTFLQISLFLGLVHPPTTLLEHRRWILKRIPPTCGLR